MSPPPKARKNPFALAVATILLLAAIAASFWVPLYARENPKLGAFPFFYWYQLLLVVAVAIVSWLAYLLLRSPSRAKALAERPEGSDPLPGQLDGELQGGPGAAR